VLVIHSINQSINQSIVYLLRNICSQKK